MDKLNNYLLSTFSQIYFSIFLPLFVIASVILLVKISAFTAYIQLNFTEMLKLYIFLLPELLFYTLPINFFIAAVMTISKLSFDYEMLVMFSLGIKPYKIILMFTKWAAMQSILLFILFFIVTPHTKSLIQDFMAKKRSEAKFNIEASEYGHKFGKWLIFVGEDKADGNYGNVILYNKNKDDETLIIADSADVINKNNVLKLELKNGNGYTYSQESISQMKFRTMHINDTSGIDRQKYKNTMQYWFNDAKLMKNSKKGSHEYLIHKGNYRSKLDKLTKQTLFTLFPILSVMLILSIGVVNARHQKGYTYLYIFTTVILFYVTTFIVTKWVGVYTIALVSVATILLSYLIYYKKVAKRY